MRGFTYGAVVAAVVAGAAADSCDVVDFNYYCKKVDKITYKNVVASTPGTYQRVTSMDSTSGVCSSEPKSFDGPMKPLDEDLSFHFRGPGKLQQFAVYYPTDKSTKVKARSPHSDHIKHGHQAFHQKRHAEREAGPAPTPAAALSERQYDDAGQPEFISATIDGKLVSWANSLYSGASEPTPAPVPAAGDSKKGKGHEQNHAEDSAPASIIPGDWVRHSYYNARERVAHDVTFLNNMGGAESGVFDMTFGNSLGYASADGQACSAGPEILDDVLIPSNNEVILFSGKKCEAGSCGYTRPGTVAYHGWEGENKAFFMEFTMPSDGQTGFNADMPAAWFLNAQIPRTLQYGNADCSCWTTGCGELDVFETLASGETRMKSTLHGYYDGGDSDWFQRPTTTSMKAAVVMSNGEIHIQVLKGDHEFGHVQTQSLMESFSSIADDIESAIFSLIT